MGAASALGTWVWPTQRLRPHWRTDLDGLIIAVVSSSSPHPLLAPLSNPPLSNPPPLPSQFPNGRLSASDSRKNEGFAKFALLTSLSSSSMYAQAAARQCLQRCNTFIESCTMADPSCTLVVGFGAAFHGQACCGAESESQLFASISSRAMLSRILRLCSLERTATRSSKADLQILPVVSSSVTRTDVAPVLTERHAPFVYMPHSPNTTHTLLHANRGTCCQSSAHFRPGAVDTWRGHCEGRRGIPTIV